MLNSPVLGAGENAAHQSRPPWRFSSSWPKCLYYGLFRQDESIRSGIPSGCETIAQTLISLSGRLDELQHSRQAIDMFLRVRGIGNELQRAGAQSCRGGTRELPFAVRIRR